MTVAYILLTSLTTAWTVLSILALLRRRRRPQLLHDEPITILKPLRGADHALEQNLRSCFEQDYPNFNIVFGVEGFDDPALRVVERLRAQYPSVDSRLVVHQGGRALNPKVRNLLAMLRGGTEDVVVISDSNIRVPTNYLSTSLAALQQGNTGLVSHPIVGIDADTLGAAVESSYLGSSVVASIVTASEIFQHASVIGKSMMFRRSVLDQLGGLESVSNVLAEDYVLGRMFQHAGYQVTLADTPVGNSCEGITLAGTFDRMTRWSMLRARAQPLAYLLEPLTSPLMILGLAPMITGVSPWPMLGLTGWAWVLMLARDLAASVRVDQRVTWRQLLVAPLRELVWLSAWLTALGHRHVSWRGHRLRVSAGTRLYQLPRS